MRVTAWEAEQHHMPSVCVPKEDTITQRRLRLRLMEAFYCLLGMLAHAFEGNPISEADCHSIMRCLKDYSAFELTLDPTQLSLHKVSKAAALAEAGWPPAYDPVHRGEKVRFAMTVEDCTPSHTINALVRQFDRLCPTGTSVH